MAKGLKLFIATVLTVGILLITLVHILLNQRAVATYEGPAPQELFSAVSKKLPVLEPVDDTTIDQKSLYCLALNIYHEAASEKRIGKDAVAHVTLTRVDHPRYSDTVCGVVYAGKHYRTSNGNFLPVKNKCHFSWYCDGKPDQLNLVHEDGKPNFMNIKAWEESIESARDAILGLSDDPTNGATHYFNPDLANPSWQHVLTKTAVIYSHQFHVEDA